MYSSAPGAAAAVFTLAALTDWLDGYLARASADVTRFGQFMDPLADKLLIGAALVALVQLYRFPLWAAVVIAVRELVVSLFRSVKLRGGYSIPASSSGKIKTAIQVPMVLVWLLPRSGIIQTAQDIAVYLVVALTLWSGFRVMTRVR